MREALLHGTARGSGTARGGARGFGAAHGAALTSASACRAVLIFATAHGTALISGTECAAARHSRPQPHSMQHAHPQLCATWYSYPELRKSRYSFPELCTTQHALPEMSAASGRRRRRAKQNPRFFSPDPTGCALREYSLSDLHAAPHANSEVSTASYSFLQLSTRACFETPGRRTVGLRPGAVGSGAPFSSTSSYVKLYDQRERKVWSASRTLRGSKLASFRTIPSRDDPQRATLDA